MTSSSEPLMLAILDTRLRKYKKPILDIAAFMHKKYTEYLLTCLNGNIQVMDLVDGWCEMGVKYSLEMENCKKDVSNSKLFQLMSENADMKHELVVLKKQMKGRDAMGNDEYLDENHENSEILENSETDSETAPETDSETASETCSENDPENEPENGPENYSETETVDLQTNLRKKPATKTLITDSETKPLNHSISNSISNSRKRFREENARQLNSSEKTAKKPREPKKQLLMFCAEKTITNVLFHNMNPSAEKIKKRLGPVISLSGLSRRNAWFKRNKSRYWPTELVFPEIADERLKKAMLEYRGISERISERVNLHCIQNLCPTASIWSFLEVFRVVFGQKQTKNYFFLYSSSLVLSEGEPKLPKTKSFGISVETNGNQR